MVCRYPLLKMEKQQVLRLLRWCTHTHTRILTHHILTHNNLPTYPYTNLPTYTHNLLTHDLLTHKLPTHQLTHTHNLLTHHLLTHNLPTYHLPTHQLTHTPTQTHTTYSHTSYVVTSTFTWRHRSAFCVAGVALMALGWLWWRAGSPLPLWSPLPFAWQAWHLVTSAFTSCGGVALGDTDRHFAWPACHLCHWAASGARLGPVCRLAAAVCVAGVALGHIDLHFAWQAWHLVTSIATLRGSRGTYGTGLALVVRLGPVAAVVPAAVCVAGVALGHIDLHFAWQAWHLVTSIATLRGRRGTYSTGLALVARLGPVCCRGRRGRLSGRRGTW